MPNLALAVVLATAAHAATDPGAPIPVRLGDTGLFLPGQPDQISDAVVPFEPQYPLWSDGTKKSRWIFVPKGRFINTQNLAAWRFPVGTRFWKEFRVGARRIETRTIWRTPRGWRFATYVWNDEQSEAYLAPESGRKVELGSGSTGRHHVPSRGDCLTCHDNGETPILGFSALQLAHTGPETLETNTAVIKRNLFRPRVDERVLRMVRIDAETPVERAALGYLHGNCGGCHNDRGPLASVGLSFDQSRPDGVARTRASVLRYPSVFRLPGHSATERVAPGHPEHSILVLRMRSRTAAEQMPPLGTTQIDEQGAALVERWILEMKDRPGSPEKEKEDKQ